MKLICDTGCDKNNTKAKMKNCEEYTMSCKQETPEVIDEMTKRIERKQILSKYMQQLFKKI